MTNIKINYSSRTVFIGLLMTVLFVFHFSGATDGKLGYFQDRDGDGLTDEEEMALGTDWQNDDTDGDGYTDGVEIAGGYNPLIPAPGDKISDEDEGITQVVSEKEKQQPKNLTEEFMKRLKMKKGETISTFANSSEDGLIVDPAKREILSGVSLTSEDIQALAQETIGEVDIESEMTEVSEDELNILPKVKAKSDRKKKEKIREEIDEYLAETGFIFMDSIPFAIGGQVDFSDKLNDFMVGIGQDIVTGNDLNVRQSKDNLKKALIDLKKVKTPFVLKDLHKRLVSLLQYLVEQDESVVFRKDDPIAMSVMIGRLQSIMDALQTVQMDFDILLTKYEIVDRVEY